MGYRGVRNVVVVGLLAVMAVGGCSPAVRPALAAPPTGAPSPPQLSTPSPSGWQNEMLSAVNAERAATGSPPLALCATLNTAAQGHSDDQAARRTMSHTGGDGSTMSQRIERAGYTGWTRLGENVAAGYPTIAAVMTGWMNSPGHRQNLLDSRFTHLGVGQATNGSIYWTQDFGTSGAC